MSDEGVDNRQGALNSRRPNSPDDGLGSATGVAMRVLTGAAKALGVLALLVLCGCVSERERVEDMEQTLAAAGFKMQAADTPDKQTQLATLPPHKLLLQQLKVGDTPTTGYVYSDPDVCHCLFVGDANAYQKFAQLAFEKKLAEQNLEAAEIQEDAALDWGVWGPGFWGPAPVVVIPARR